MKKRPLLVLSSIGILSIAAVVSLSTLGSRGLAILADPESYNLSLNDKSLIESKDYGYLHELKIKNNYFDFIGWSSGSTNLGNIKRQTYGDSVQVTYDGMVFNKSVINGFISFTVNFSGGNLYYKLTNYLMEDMDFDHANAVTSGVAVNAQDYPYFVLYTDSTTGVDLNSISLNYTCDGSIDTEMVFNKNSTIGGARSLAKSTLLTDSFAELENNPTTTTNNYSVGEDAKHAYTWYRWNGRYFANSGSLGNHFEIHTTIMGNISQVVGTGNNSYFNYSAWPQFQVGDDANNYDWQYVYIGNDNYEPLGKDDPSRPHKDSYGNESYAGRFITAYVQTDPEDPNSFEFVNPDTTYTLSHPSMTYRDAYNAYTLPYWHVVYDFYYEEDGGDYEPWSDAYVNGFKIAHTPMSFSSYSGESLKLKTYQMHCVNYGNNDGSVTGINSYKGTFTYPRIVSLL